MVIITSLIMTSKDNPQFKYERVYKQWKFRKVLPEMAALVPKLPDGYSWCLKRNPKHGNRRGDTELLPHQMLLLDAKKKPVGVDWCFSTVNAYEVEKATRAILYHLRIWGMPGGEFSEKGFEAPTGRTSYPLEQSMFYDHSNVAGIMAMGKKRR